MSTTSNKPVIVDGRSSTVAKKVGARTHQLNPGAAPWTPGFSKDADHVDAASNATTAVASNPEPWDPNIPAQPVSTMDTVPATPYDYPTATHNDTTTPFDISRTPTTVPVSPLYPHRYEPDLHRLRPAPWYYPLCTPSCRTCHENTVGGLTSCHIRRYAPSRPEGGVAWNEVFRDNLEDEDKNKHINENRDYLPWWMKVPPLEPAPSPFKKKGTEKEPTAVHQIDEKLERVARRKARMAVLVHKELVYLRSMAVGNGVYYSSVLKNPEWYPGVKCPISMELWDEKGTNRFNRFNQGESQRDMMEDVMVRRMILRDRRKKGSPHLTAKEVDQIDAKLQELRDVLTAELDWEERRSTDWWDSEPFYERRRLSGVRCGDRPIHKVDERYVYI